MTRDLFHSSLTALAVALAMSAPAHAQDAPDASSDSQPGEAETAPVTTSEQAAPDTETEPPAGDSASDTAPEPASTEDDAATDAGAEPDPGSDMTETSGAAMDGTDAAVDTCPALALVDDQRGKIERVVKLVEDGLAQPSNLLGTYRSLTGPMEEALADADYDPDCYKATITALQPLVPEDVRGIPPTTLSDPVVAAWANKCADATEADAIFVCLQDTGTAISEELLTDGQAIRLVNALPLETVEMDDNEVDSLLLAVKEQVDAGNLSGNTQSQIVNRVLNQ